MFGNILQGLAKGIGNAYNQSVAVPLGHAVDQQIDNFIVNPIHNAGAAINNWQNQAGAAVDNFIRPVAQPIANLFPPPARYNIPNNPQPQAQAPSPSPMATTRPTMAPTMQPTMAPTMTPQPTQSPQFGSNLQQQIYQAYQQYNPHAPLATMSAQLAQAGQGLPDPFMPAIIGMKESSGGVNMTNPNNPMNIKDPQALDPATGRYPYPTLESNLAGQEGDHRWSFGELLNSPLYQDYKQSGNLENFFRHYTPPGGSNGTMQDNITIYKNLENKYFKRK